jgi:hypothetical protein
MDNIYVGPYTATINNGPAVQVICTDFADESYVGSNWPATANTFSTIGNTLWGQYYGVTTATTMYQEAAWITLQMLSGNYNATQIGYMSYAIWYIFDPNGTKANPIGVNQYLNGNSTILNGLLYWVNLAAGSYSGLTAAQLAEFTIYTPVGCDSPGTCQAQEFFQVPEGGTAFAYLLLAGAALIGAILVRRQRALPDAI